MAKPFSFVTAVTVVAALAVSSLAAAQDNRRTGGGTSDESSSRSGSGSGDVAGARSSAPEPSPTASPSPPSEPRPSESAGVTPAAGASSDAGAAPAPGRTRGSQPVLGFAQPRPNRPGGNPGAAYVSVRPSWSSSPYGGSYGGYYGGYYGYAASPWGYFGGLGYWNRYGIYDPFLYDPYGYYGGFYGAPFAWSSAVTYGGGSYSSNRSERGTHDLNGSLRLKVNPKTAKVYIDGALAGTADEFDGLGGHLQVPAGSHELELRAEGFQPFTTQVTVKAKRTQTERVNLKKKP